MDSINQMTRLFDSPVFAVSERISSQLGLYKSITGNSGSINQVSRLFDSPVFAVSERISSQLGLYKSIMGNSDAIRNSIMGPDLSKVFGMTPRATDKMLGIEVLPSTWLQSKVANAAFSKGIVPEAWLRSESAISEIMNLNSYSALKGTLELFGSESLMLSEQELSSFLSDNAHLIDEETDQEHNRLIENAPHNQLLKNAANEILSSEVNENAVEKYNQLPLYIKAILITLFQSALWLLYTFAEVNFSESINNFLTLNEDPIRIQTSVIKRIPSTEGFYVGSGARFISGTKVRLREQNSTKSDIIDVMHYGQVVSIVSKNKNWIEVSYFDNDDELLTGWTLTRYTSRFR